MSIKHIEAPCIVVEIRGGVVSSITANQPNIDVIIVDWDCCDEDELPKHIDPVIDRHAVHNFDLATINKTNLKFMRNRA